SLPLSSPISLPSTAAATTTRPTSGDVARQGEPPSTDVFPRPEAMQLTASLPSISEPMAHAKSDAEEEWSDSDLDEVSDSEVADALDWLDAVEGPDGSSRPSGAFSASGGGAVARRPNAHGGVLSRPLQPLSNRTQKLASHIRAAPLEEWEGRMNVGMSNSVTTAIRDSIRGAAIGKIRNTEKADRATVEQVCECFSFG
ncbi:unnamed protein product, partial [Urochloa humidicola]